MMSSEIASLYASIGADTNPLERALGKAHGLLAGMGSSMGGAISTAVGIGIAQLAGGAIKLAGGAITGAIGQASTFEQTLAMLGAVTGATSGQLGKLSDMAIQLGADTTLPGTSAVQAAQGMMELAKAGLSVDASIAAARGTIQLARAAQVSEAEAATIAANALNAYGLQGDRAGMVADLLAASANASSGSIQDMAYALRMSSAVASNAGVSIQDTVTAISLLANAGLQGSDAGTSLKTMLISLQSPSKEAAGVMKDLGIRVYDSKGHMNDFQSILGQLQGATGKLTQEQKAHALQTIFGTDAIRAANILLKAGTAGFTEMSAAVNKSGAAADLASAQNAGMAGAVDALKSTVETLGLTFAKPLLEPLTRALRQFTDWIGGADAQASITQFGTLVGNTLAEVVGWVITNWPMIRQTVGDVFAAVRSVWDTVLAPAIAGIVGAFQAAVLWVQFNWPRIQGQIQSGASEVERIYNAVLKPAVDFAIGLFRQVVAWVADNMPLMQATVATVVAKVQEAFERYIRPLLPVIAEIFGGIKQTVESVVNVVLGIIRTVMQAINGDWAGAWETIQGIGRDAWNAILGVIRTAKATLEGLMQTIGKAIEDTWNNLLRTITGLGAQIWRSIVLAWESIVASLNEKLDKIKQDVDTAWRNLVAAITGWASSVWNAAKRIWEQLWADGPEGLPGRFLALGRQLIDGLVNGIRNGAEAAFGAMRWLVDGIITVANHNFGIQSPSKVFRQMGAYMMAGLADGITGGASMAAAAMTRATDGLRAPPPAWAPAGASQAAGAGSAGQAASRQYVLNVNTVSQAEDLLADFALLQALGG